MDPVDLVEILQTSGRAAGATANGLRLLAVLKEKFATGIIAAHFDPHGQRVSGSEEINVRAIRASGDGEGRWFFVVEPVDGYTFLRFPVVDSAVVEVLGTPQGSTNRDARFWRWIELETRSPVGVDALYATSFDNVLVEFIVAGYKPDQLVTALIR